MPQLKLSRPARIIKGTIYVIVLALLIEYLITHRTDFHVLGSIRFEYLLPVFFLSGLGLLLAGLRFRLLLTHVSHPIPFYTMLKYYIYGRFLNRFLPLGGSVYRAIMLKKSDGVSYKKYVASNLAFDWLNMIYSTLLGVAVIAVYDPSLRIGSIPLLPLFCAALVPLILVSPISKAAIAIINRLIPTPSVRKRMDEATGIVEAMTDALKNRSVFAGSSAIITLVLASTLLSYHLLFKSIGVDADLAVLLVYLIVLRISRVFRITPANLGIREFMLGFLTYSLGTGTAEGVLTALLMRLIQFLVLGALSIGMFAAEKIGGVTNNRRSPD